MDCPDKDFVDFIDVCINLLIKTTVYIQKCIEWKID